MPYFPPSITSSSIFFFFSSRRRHTRCYRDWSSDVLFRSRMDLWTPMARAVRGTFDFVRYFHPRLAEAPILRARIKRKVLPRWLGALDRIHSLDERALARVYRLLERLESAI